MKKLIFILLIIGIGLSQGVFEFSVHELDKSTNPWTMTYANVESVLVIRYDDDASTVVESLYTDSYGLVEANDAFRGDNYERAQFVKSGYSFFDNGWIRFSTTNFDTQADTIAISGQIFTAPGDSTVTITFTLIESDGTANASQTVSFYSAASYIGTSNSLYLGGSGTDPFSRTTYTSNSSGVVTVTTTKGNIGYVVVGSRLLTPQPFIPDSNMTLNNIVFDPGD